jgi:hypothetical protein
MATLGDDVLTFADLKKRMDPNGMPAMIAELLMQSNPILDDIPWKASNRPEGNQSTIRTELPTVNLRRLNQGTVSSKSVTNQIEDGMAMIEAWSTTDVKLLKLYGNEAATRMGEAKAFIEAMGQKVAELIFEGAVADDDREFNGIRSRYDDTSGDTSDNILDCGGSGNDMGSIYLVGWGDTVHGIYPKNTQAGLVHNDHGQQIIQTDDDLGGAKLSAFVDQWSWDCGIVVKDWRNIVRLVNLDVADWQGVTGTEQSIDDYATNAMYLMARAMHRIPNLAAVRPVFYMPRAVFEGFDVQSLARTTANVFESRQVDGKMLTTFRGIPMKICDQLGIAESAI